MRFQKECEDKGPNKYLASMVLKTLFSIMCEEIKSLNNGNP